MANKRGFWMFMNAGLLVFYAVAAGLFLTGTPWNHMVVLLALLILAAHALEIPVSLKVLSDQNPNAGRVALMTLLFGFTWWLPAKRGIYAVR